MANAKLRLVLDPSLVLRTVEESDAKPLFRLIDSNRDHLGRWLAFVDETRSHLDTLAFIRDVSARDREGGGFALVIQEAGDPRGLIGLDPIEKGHERASIGYWLVERAQGRGLMTRALDAVVRHAFDALALNRLSLHAATDNVRSRAVAARVGFVQEGVHRQADKNRGRYLDMVAYALLRSDRPASPAKVVSPMRTRELSKTTLYGRVHELFRLEARRDVDALLDFIDPKVRDARGSDHTLASDRARIEAFVRDVRLVTVEDVSVLHAEKVAPGQAGRPAARVRTVVRYDGEADPVVVESEWVREHGVWYTTRYPPDTP